MKYKKVASCLRIIMKIYEKQTKSISLTPLVPGKKEYDNPKFGLKISKKPKQSYNFTTKVSKYKPSTRKTCTYLYT